VSSKEVDTWFAKYDNPMKPVAQEVRRIIMAADPKIEEIIKWQAPTFMYNGNLASFFPKSKQHASLMFHTGAQIPGKFPSLEGDGETSRVMKFASVADVKKKQNELRRIVKAWIKMKSSAAK
jgi:uncharacterized protein YdhG (YjbR/CyaY superfamily)